jgi:hypothetical protein
LRCIRSLIWDLSVFLIYALMAIQGREFCPMHSVL